MKKIITAAALLTGILSFITADTGLKFSGAGELFLSQNGSSFETEGSTPRVAARKRAEYKEDKSPLVAAGLSLLVPGAGEFYGRDYIRSSIFFGVEVFTLSMWYYYESDGDDKRDEYRDFANRNFDEDIYYMGLMGMTQNTIEWLENKNSTEEGFEFDASEIWNLEHFKNRGYWSWEDENDIPDEFSDYIFADSLSVTSLLYLSFATFNQDHIDPTNEAYWVREIELFGGSAQFTHNLPATKTQQYYEMIGKYHQFACGWNDFDGYEYDAEGNLIMDTKYIENSAGEQVAVEIPRMKLDENVFNYSENGYNSEKVDFYEDLRNKTNEAYETGQNFLMITLLNHVASAFDASYVIKKNFQIETSLDVEPNDKASMIGKDNYKLTYSVKW